MKSLVKIKHLDCIVMWIGCNNKLIHSLKMQFRKIRIPWKDTYDRNITKSSMQLYKTRRY